MSDEEKQFADLLGGVYQELQISEQVLQYRVRQVWDESFGSAFASYVTAFRLHNRILYVSISSDALRQELFMNRQKILTHLNQALKLDYLQEVVIK